MVTGGGSPTSPCSLRLYPIGSISMKVNMSAVEWWFCWTIQTTERGLPDQYHFLPFLVPEWTKSPSLSRVFSPYDTWPVTERPKIINHKVLCTLREYETICIRSSEATAPRSSRMGRTTFLPGRIFALWSIERIQFGNLHRQMEPL